MIALEFVKGVEVLAPVVFKDNVSFITGFVTFIVEFINTLLFILFPLTLKNTLYNLL